MVIVLLELPFIAGRHFLAIIPLCRRWSSEKEGIQCVFYRDVLISSILCTSRTEYKCSVSTEHGFGHWFSFFVQMVCVFFLFLYSMNVCSSSTCSDLFCIFYHGPPPPISLGKGMKKGVVWGRRKETKKIWKGGGREYGNNYNQDWPTSHSVKNKVWPKYYCHLISVARWLCQTGGSVISASTPKLVRILSILFSGGPGITVLPFPRWSSK